jgi:hypothetical protein
VHLVTRYSFIYTGTNPVCAWLCEGGARSISVFDNDIGSGSISPLIVTGGKNGDVGLHDFRYIATGRTKRHNMNSNLPSNIDMQTGVGRQLGGQNPNGMLWYMPKAHLGMEASF